MALENFKNLKSEKKDKILDAIANCLSIHDYDELSINDITKEAQIARGSFYNYFSDKADAVYTLLVDRLIKLTDEFRRCIIIANGELFKGCETTYETIKNYLQKELHRSFYKNIKFMMDFCNKIIYSKEFELEIEDGINWLLNNTKEGKNVLSDKKLMANTFGLILAITLSSVSEFIVNDNGGNIKYNDFYTKLNIVKAGINNISFDKG